jgi:hypothetical protein
MRYCHNVTNVTFYCGRSTATPPLGPRRCVVQLATNTSYDLLLPTQPFINTQEHGAASSPTNTSGSVT